jgi:hypothetical protein
MSSRAGRKRKVGEREPNGRLSQAVRRAMEPTPPAQAKRLRDAALRRMEDEAYGWEIGRLWVENRLDAHEWEAGKRLRRLTEELRKLKGGPNPNPKTVRIGEGHGGHDADPDSERGIEEARRTIELAAVVSAAVGAITPGVIRSTVLRVVELDEPCTGPHGRAWLRDGLADLARHWRIERP